MGGAGLRLRLHRRRPAVALVTACAIGGMLASAHSSRAVTYEPAPPFCDGAIARDFLAPFKRMPKLHAPAPTGRVGFGPASLRLQQLPSLLVGEGSVGYELSLRRSFPTVYVGWDVTTTLTRIDWRGRAIETLDTMHRHVRAVRPRQGAGAHFDVSKEPATYRVTAIFYSQSGRKLGGYGFYFRVVALSRRAQLKLNAAQYRPETRVFGRVENFGSEPIFYGAPYRIEKLEGTTWIKAPESPRWFILPLYAVGPGLAGDQCSGFWIPPTMPPGRYRMSKEVDFGDWRPPRNREPAVLTAEFDIVP